MRYRSDIDGLRALAVIPVILFHAGFELFSGGFIGVDVFFVISGYLITSLLLEDIEKNQFSILNFYERRARRILPALTFMMIISVILAWVLLSDISIRKFGNGVMGVSLFVSNIVFWRQQGYFDESAELNPLLHTWSLAVEEQYYLLFPIFLILTWRFGKSIVFWLIVVLTLMSLLLGEWGSRNYAAASFYLAPTRAWELFAGSITAFIIQQRGLIKSNSLACLGLAAIIFSIFIYDENTPFPGMYALVPVLGVILIIMYSTQDSIVSKFLSMKAIVGVGLISYSAYIWHQPLFSFTRIFKNEIHLSNEIKIFLIIVTFAMAFLSWKFIEMPFRDKSKFKRHTIFALSIGSILGVFLLGVATINAVKENEYLLAKQLSKNEFVYFENLDERKFIEGRLIYPLDKAESIVVGSSRVMQVNSTMFDKPILNFSVSGASLEDDIAIALEAVSKLDAKNVYLSADPWLLNKYGRQNNFKSIETLYRHWLDKASHQNIPESFFSEEKIKTIDSSQNNILSFLRKKLYQKKLSIPLNSEAEAIAKKAYDGFHIYNEAYVEKSKQDITKGFPALLNYAMKEYELDSELQANLTNLVQYLKSLDVKVTLILSPYHPGLFKMMETEKPIFLEIENNYKAFAAKNDIEIIGSYNGKDVGCKNDEFYDGQHPKSSCMHKVFKSND